MRHFHKLAIALWAAALATAQTGVHPGFTFTSLRPAGFEPMVGGLDFLPDGRLVVATWEGFGATKGSVYLVSGAQGGDASKVGFVKYASNLNEPLGVKVMDGEIYLLQKDKLSWLPDANHDGKADSARKVASGWTVQPGADKSLEFAMGLLYRDSAFYGGLATNWPLSAKQTQERGCIIAMSPKTGGFEPYACGTRTPNGLVLGPEDGIFTTENQGNWVPSSKLLHIRKGHFYGVHKTPPSPFDKEKETPPVLWLDHGNIGISPTQPVYLKSGVFRGQMLAGDNRFGTLQRYFLEKVAGEWQGAVFRFSAGLEAGANRIVTGPDGALYVGGIGTQEWGGWDWNAKNTGLQRLSENGKKFFDVLALRSKGATSMELEFTDPAGTGADVIANYRAQQWAYIPEEAYGAGKQTVQNLTISKATVSADKLRVTLEIAGMQAGSVVYLKLSNLVSAAGTALWSTEAWYTQNAFGPGTPVAVGEGPKARNAESPQVRALRRADGTLSVRVSGSGAFQAEIRDAGGRLRETRNGAGPGEFASRAAYGPGLYLVSVRNAAGTVSLKVALP